MTTKEKAEDLVDKMSPNCEFEFESKKCALIVVDEILSQLQTIDYADYSEDYNFLIGWWNEVKKEINNY